MYDPRILDTDSIIESAHIATGLDDMVDDGLRARIEEVISGFRDAGDFTPDQAIATRRQIVKLLSRRISIAGDIQKHPEILDEQIETPIFVIGFMRTGTSIMQALLASDPANRGVEAWQTREPSPPPGEGPVAPYRKRLAGDEVYRFVERSEGLIALHPYWDEWEKTLIEDDEIFTLDFRNSYPTMFYEAPMLGPFEEDEDNEGRYRFLKMFLQHQQWNMPKKRWAVKGVDHQAYLQTLLKVFPDAKCIFVHREPGDFLPSGLAIGMNVYDGVNSGSLTRKQFGEAMMAIYRERLPQIAADPTMDLPNIKHLKFRDFISDPIATLREAYSDWGFTWTEEGEAAMRSWLDNPANKSDRYGKHKYRFEPYGVDWEKESPAFDSYRARFLADG